MDALTKWSGPVATEARRRLRFKQLALLAFAGVAAVSGSGYGYFWWITGRFIESTDDAYVRGNVTPISPHIAGFVAGILVTDNQRVDAGQVLVRLDDRDARAVAERAEAVLNQRTAWANGHHRRSTDSRFAGRQVLVDSLHIGWDLRRLHR
jgi:membrane fusion protein (multidrug efflux system)